MSDILSAMVTFVLASSEVTTLVGTRLYPERLPAGSTAEPTTMPCITYQLIDEPLITTHDLKVICRARVQMDVWGGTYKSAHATAEALSTLLHGYRGAWGDFVIGNVMRKAKRDQSEPDVELHRVVQDFIVSYR